MRRLALSFPVLALAACAESAVPASPPGGTSIEVKVAPLTLPGLGDACYDVEVRNQANQIVWSRGDFNVQHPADPTALCATQFGNGSGGDISYVGPCDADSPAHAVHLAVDTLYDATNQPLADWQNPCPGIAPCKLNVTCEENADTPVSFNLTIMRAAQQGFFDVAVNFDAIFCSAKVDCTYDAAGNEPIELLHDPATGERVQTAVIGLACSAGPGSDVDTALMMSDVRVYCGETSPVMFAGYFMMTCDEVGAAHYGALQTLGPDGFAFDGAVWQRDMATGSYTASPLTFTGLPSVPADEQDTEWSGTVYVMLPNDRPLALLVRTEPPTNPAEPFTAFRELRPALATLVNPTTFDVAQVLQLESDIDPTAPPISLPVWSDSENWLVTRSAVDGGSEGPGDLTFTAHERTSLGSFGPPIRLTRPLGPFSECDAEGSFGDDAFVASCRRQSDGAWVVHIWDLTDTPVASPRPGLTPNEAAGRGRAPPSFQFSADGTDDANPAAVSAVERLFGLGFIRGEGTEPDRVILTAELSFSNADGRHSYFVHAVRDSDDSGVFDLSMPPYDQNPLPSDNPPAEPPPYYHGTHSAGVVFPPPSLGDARPVILGALFFDEGYRSVVIRHERGGSSHSVARTFREGSGGPELFPDSLDSGLFHPNGDFFALGVAWFSDGAYRPFLAQVTGTEGVAMPLPVPDGYSIERVTGVRGTADPDAGPERRLSGLVVDEIGQRRIITWVVRHTDSGGVGIDNFELDRWYVHGTTDDVPAASADWSDLDSAPRRGAEASPLFDSVLRRCPQTVDDYIVDDDAPAFADATLIVDPALDTPGLDAVSTHVPLPATGFPLGTLIIRDPAEAPQDLVPSFDPDQAVLFDPALSAEGNLWTSTNPKPSETPDYVRQMASYHGEESLDCDGQPCNKLYWNTAIAFDPTVPDCRLAFEATAARVSSLEGGQLPPNTSWPMLIGRVPLTTSAEEGQEASLACTRHPLGSPQLQTLYKPQDFDWQACYGFGTTGAPPSMTGGGECPLTAEDYLMFEFMILAGGGEGP